MGIISKSMESDRLETVSGSIADSNVADSNGSNRETASRNGRGSARAKIGIQESVNRPLHRLREHRNRLGLSVGEVAMRMGISPSLVWIQESPESDVTLTTLTEWSKALKLPVSELLVEHHDGMELVEIQRQRLSAMLELVHQMVDTSEEGQDSACVNLATRLATQIEQLSQQRSFE